MSELTNEQFKEAVGRFATGVAVVTAVTPSGPAGFTCQSLTSLSLTPLLVSFSAASAGNTWGTMRGGTTFAVNVLGDEQAGLAKQFATSGIDKFAGVDWTPGHHGDPVLANALSVIEGTVVSVTVAGDHDVIVLAVTRTTHRDGEPLLYFQGEFRTLA
jgi:flavin reductase (DIM6/NTAB) family NADH-FMN oxidoreductase RutF